MAGQKQIEFPPDAELRDLVLAEGVPAAARRFGLNPATLRNHLDTRGLPTRKAARTVERKEIDDPLRVENDQLRAEVKGLKKENKEYAERHASQEDFLERIAEECRRPVKAPKLKVKAQPKGLPRRSVITPVFDVQYGQQVQAEDTPSGRGAYSTAIFDQRLKRWFEGVTGSIRDYAASHRITELVIPLGGDFVEGHGIFPGQEWQLEIDPAQQVWQFASKFAGDQESGVPGALPELIRFAKEEIGIPKIRVYGVPGNHGKPGGRKAGALHSTHSWDWLALMLMRDKLREQPITEFAIEPAGALYFGAAKHVFLMIHGDEIRGWGGIPFYGIQRYQGKSVRQGHILYDYLLLGDKHIPAELEQGGGGETLMSGAWVGENNLARQLGAAARPQQRIYFVAEKWGITESARIYFEGAEDSRTPAQVYG